MSTIQRGPLNLGADGAAQRYRVVVVDDDPHVAALHGKVVAHHPSLILAGVARTGASALAAVARVQPDLLLLDIYLPDISGVEVLRRLRTAPGICVDVIAITAAREMDTVRAAMSSGVLHYLIKPFALPELTTRLERFVALRREVAAAESSGVDQAAVDRLLGGSPASGVSRTQLPKGIAARTLETVRVALSQVAGDVSADEIAARTGVSRVVARRYLEYLVSCGQARARPRYGVPGRPETRYSPR